MGEVTDILEFWGLFSTWVSIHFVRFYVMFMLAVRGVRAAGPQGRRDRKCANVTQVKASKKNNLLYSFRDYGILTLYVLAKVY